MPQFNSPRFERLFIQPQTGGVGVINNGGGTWTPGTGGTVSGAQLLRVNDGASSLLPVVQLIPQDWKTGTRSAVAGIVGRKNARWTLNNVPVVPNGLGVVPDMDPLLMGIFGQAGVVSGGVSVTYSFADNTFVPITLLKFQHGLPTLTQRVLGGATVEQASFTFNQTTFQSSFSGGGFYCIDNNNFPNEDATGKMGLTTFPLESLVGVANTTVHGAILSGFVGSLTVPSALTGAPFSMTPATAPVLSMTLTIKTGNLLYTDAYGTVYPSIQGGGLRKVTVAFDFQDTDSAAIVALKNAAIAKTPFPLTIVVGNTAGSTVTFTVQQLQIEIPSMADDTARVKTAFAESEAHATVPSAVDDLIMAFT